MASERARTRVRNSEKKIEYVMLTQMDMSSFSVDMPSFSMDVLSLSVRTGPGPVRNSYSLRGFTE